MFLSSSLLLILMTGLSINAIDETRIAELNAIKLYDKGVKAGENLIGSEKEKIIGLVDPFERNETQTHPLRTLTRFFSLPYGIEILIIIFTPVVVAATLRYISNMYFALQCPQKSYQDDRRRGIFYEPSPQLPLHYIQQTKLEGQVKRESRQTLSWYSKCWVLKTNELIDEVGGFSQYSNKHDPDQKLYLLKENRWKIIQTAVRVGGMYTKFMKERKNTTNASKRKHRMRRKSMLLKLKSKISLSKPESGITGKDVQNDVPRPIEDIEHTIVPEKVLQANKVPKI